jgi:hypothetical protein
MSAIINVINAFLNQHVLNSALNDFNKYLQKIVIVLFSSALKTTFSALHLKILPLYPRVAFCFQETDDEIFELFLPTSLSSLSTNSMIKMITSHISVRYNSKAEGNNVLL